MPRCMLFSMSLRFDKRMLFRIIAVFCLIGIVIVVERTNPPLENKSKDLFESLKLLKLIQGKDAMDKVTMFFTTDLPANTTSDPLEEKRQMMRHLFEANSPTIPSTLNVSAHPLFPGFIIENPKLCVDEEVDILIYIHSPVKNSEWRFYQRETWASKKNFQDINVKVIFILGLSADKGEQLSVFSEYAAYGDIVQGNFLDTFKNLTYKAITMLTWVNSHCIQAKYILKADGEMFVDTFYVIEFLLPKIYSMPLAFLCDYKENLSVLRNPDSKWFMNNSLTRTRKTWPTLCPGYFVIATGRIIPHLYRNSFAIKEYMSVDDVYLFGVLSEKVSSVRFVTIHGSISPLVRTEALKEIKNKGNFTYAAFEVNQAKVLKELWDAKLTRLTQWGQERSAVYQTFHSDNHKS